MSAADLAALHARCFVVPRPFTADEITGFLADASCFLVGDAEGFALGRAILDEAELLTLAVDPPQRRQGLGRRLMQGFEAEAAKRGAVQAYLEQLSAHVPVTWLGPRLEPHIPLELLRRRSERLRGVSPA